MRCSSLVLAILFATPAARSQERAPAERGHSFADQYVRHVIEWSRVVPPAVDSGERIGEGAGPLVLLHRDEEGRLTFESVRRPTEKETAPAPPKSTLLPEEEEEVGAGEAKRERETATSNRTVRIDRNRDGVALRLGPDEVVERAEQLDREAWAAALGAVPEPAEGVLMIVECGDDVLLGDVITACAVARGVGLRRFGFGGARRAAPAGHDSTVLPTLVQELDWQRDERGLVGGEVLFLLDRDEGWGAVANRLQQCASLGIWRIGFVGQDADGKRFRIPTDLPVEG